MNHELFKNGELAPPYLLFSERKAIATHFGCDINSITAMFDKGLLNVRKCKNFALEIKRKKGE